MGNVKVNIKVVGSEKVKIIGEVLEEMESKLEQLRGMLADAIDVEVEPEEQITRATAIQKAKEYVKKYSPYDVSDMGYTDINVEYHVNDIKRAVTVLYKGNSGKVYAKGVAKCAPGDVFNVHIGKAIALAKAKKFDVPHIFTHAPRPENARVGMMVETLSGKCVKLTERAPQYDGARGYAFNVDNSMLWVGETQFEIYDDSDVEYAGAE